MPSVLRAVAAFVGAIAFYAAFFMYEDEEGRWQNKLEELWIAIDDRARTVMSRSAALVAKVAEIVTSAFDRRSH
jgi:hypothetical protein